MGPSNLLVVMTWRGSKPILDRFFLLKFLLLRPSLLRLHCIELIRYFNETKNYMLDHKLRLYNQDEAL